MKKRTTSKVLVFVAIVQFFIIMGYAIVAPILELSTDMLSYLIPSSAGMAAVVLGFYFNKAKIENLSKQKIRNVYLKLLLEDKLTPSAYTEIENELNEIDGVIDNKLSNDLSNAISEDIDAQM